MSPSTKNPIGTKNFVAIDLGKKRVGIAVGDSDTRLATPLTVLDGKDRRQLIDTLIDLAEQRQAEFVLGLPLSMEAKETRTTKSARAFARTLQRASERTVHLQDETLTSAEALEKANQVGRSSYDPIDDLAAQIILQDFLDNL